MPTRREVLRWAGDEFGDGLVVTAGFGDAVLVHLVSQAIPDADIVLLDTGYLFAETEWFADHLRQRYRLNLRTVHPRPDAEPDQWRTDTDACCHARKVEPMQRVLAGKTAWVTGVRRSDSPARAEDAGRPRRPAPPGDQDQPARHLDRRRRRPLQGDRAAARASRSPTAATRSIGCWPCTRPVADGDDPRSGRWAGSDKTECGLHVSGADVPVSVSGGGAS